MRNVLNPAAGQVPQPEDGDVVDAAVRAGRISYRLWPYYGWRYGRRGEAFTRSDSGWLAWVAEQPQDVVDAQVTWLAGVLAARGMPSPLLADHLRVLHRQLARVRPDDPAWDRLLAVADRLVTVHAGIGAGGATPRAAAVLQARLGLPAARLLDGAAHLLAWAVADQRAGVAGGTAPLRRWLDDLDAWAAEPALRAALPAAHVAALDASGAVERWVAALDAVEDVVRADLG